MRVTWHPAAYEFLLAGHYEQVAHFYEAAIETQPEEVTHYWHLGLAYLLLGEEEAAQATWLTPAVEADDEQVNQWSAELVQILDTEAQRQEVLGNQQQELHTYPPTLEGAKSNSPQNWGAGGARSGEIARNDVSPKQLSWLIRGHIREIAPTNLNNLLRLIKLSLETNTFEPSALTTWRTAELLRSSPPEAIDVDLLREVVQALLDFPDLEPEILDSLKASFICSTQPQTLIAPISAAANRAFHLKRQPEAATALLDICLEVAPNDIGLLKIAYYLYLRTGHFQTAIELAKRFLSFCDDLPSRAFGHYAVLLSLLFSGGAWQETQQTAQALKAALSDLLSERELQVQHVFSLLCTPSLLSCIEDDLTANRRFHNRLAQFCQQHIQPFQPQTTDRKVSRSGGSGTQPLRIGYIAHSLNRHSVGWLSRWLFQYHNREQFHISIYFVNHPIDGFTEHWFVKQAHQIRHIEDCNPEAIAQRIVDDKIDLLVDLDSVTDTCICNVMAYKPAPVQITWLGFDASGLPSIDYFIADPFVLPAHAQDHYRETIWRLPHTYIAVDGFEAYVPSRRREDLDLPADAMIYFSAQNGHKRHPQTARLQMKILREVPNSYLLIKGFADHEALKTAFTQLAEEEGVDPNHLRFLSRDPNEYIHRANLQIADVVLDTYPYNGATTTLEVLWMGIPLVTRVGEQFSARNSYAFMTNAGLTEGIAWTDEEYIEWGVRLGRDEALRQNIAWKLRMSRQTSPLWNGKQFTKEMEQAYHQIWECYLSSCALT